MPHKTDTETRSTRTLRRSSKYPSPPDIFRHLLGRAQPAHDCPSARADHRHPPSAAVTLWASPRLDSISLNISTATLDPHRDTSIGLLPSHTRQGVGTEVTTPPDGHRQQQEGRGSNSRRGQSTQSTRRACGTLQALRPPLLPSALGARAKVDRGSHPRGEPQRGPPAWGRHPSHRLTDRRE